MKIKSPYKEYIQKSRLFLYPMLGIKRGFSVTPIQTYMSWEGQYNIIENKFITVYHMREDRDFKIFEDVKLLGNPFFETFFELEDEGQGAYVFDFSEHADDFQNIAQGNYSQLSDSHKKTVLNFFRSHRNHHVYIESYLYPEKYFSTYADFLITNKGDHNAMLHLLKEVGELCSRPDHEQEQLKMGVDTMTFKEFVLDLQS